MTKRVLFLGAAAHQMPAIEYAKSKGHYVITCDYLPENPGHQVADEWHDVSTTDLDGVLSLAKKVRADGIVAYASDPAAPTQAYVAQKLSLPGNPYDSVLTLARKDYFRDFLTRNGFLVPKSAAFSEGEDATDWLHEIGFPAIVKPVDSSGSKGVTKIEDPDVLVPAIQLALEFSRAKRVVVEEFFERSGYQVAGDGFIVDGELKFRCWGQEHFDHDCNPRVPIGESFPSIMSDYTLEQAQRETQRLLDLLGMKTGALNFDFHYNDAGNFSFLELGPRNGGNLIPDVIKVATGVDLIRATVDAALGLDTSWLRNAQVTGFYSSYIIHAVEDGILKDIRFSQHVRERQVYKNLSKTLGDKVRRFSGSHDTVGMMILQYRDIQEMLSMMDNMNQHISVDVE